MKKVWFITGGSRGLGRKITEAELGNRDLVAARPETSKQEQTIRNHSNNSIIHL